MMDEVPAPKELGLDLPAWRPGQAEAISQILDALEDVDTVVVDGPPGTGKSVIANAAAIRSGLRTLFLTGTKALQSRYSGPPTSLPTAVGRANYPCALVFGATAAEGPCAFNYECPERFSCEYVLQRNNALAAPIAVVNYALAMSDPNGIFLNERDLLVLDECHLLEGQAADHFAIRLDLEMAQAGLEGLPPLPSDSSVDSYRRWAEEIRPRFEEELILQEAHIEAREGAIRKFGMVYIRRLSQLCEALERLFHIDDTWIPFSSNINVKGVTRTQVFKPTDVALLLQSRLWRPGVKRILMSGSIGDAEALIKAVGAGKYRLVTVSSSIHPRQRPIVYWPRANVTNHTWGQSIISIAEALDRLIDKHSDCKGIVHTTSGELADRVQKLMKHGHIVFMHGTQNRAHVFEDFRAAPPPAVLISPSAYYGEDFPGDEARWQAIAKVPYPPLGDPWVKAKMEADPGWYDQKTVQGLIQAAGRVVRGPDDWGTTYILDEKFETVFRRNPQMFPAWFHEGLAAGGGIDGNR